MAKIGFCGDSRRGKEIITLLEMLGGKNIYQLKGCDISKQYTIDKDNYIVPLYKAESCCLFSLEDFENKYPIKIGDKVILKNGCTNYIARMTWNGEQVVYKVNDFEEELFVEDLIPCKEETDLPMGNAIENAYKECVFGNKDSKFPLAWVQENNNEFKILLAEDFELKTKEDGILYAVRKKSQYPKTYEECCDVLDINPILNCPNLCICEKHPATSEISTHFSFRRALGDIYTAFMKLLICRDAYWKLAGDWKPDYKDPFKEKWVFRIEKGENIYLTNTEFYNAVLAFPTKEMRDAFNENFKDLIEKCKELL